MLEKPPGQINRQIPLAIQINDETRLNDFCWKNNELLQQLILKTLAGSGEHFITLWGNSGSGKSHLLQGCCQAISDNQTSSYLPMKVLKEWGPSSIEGVHEQALIALDDIHLIAGDLAWEEAIFHLYNKVRDKEDTILIISSQLPLSTLKISLADLYSRLSWGLVIQLHELTDELKIQALQQYAKKRGFELPTNVVEFLINRCARNMHDLHFILEQIDGASLAAHRKVTIPFVKSILEL